MNLQCMAPLLSECAIYLAANYRGLHISPFQETSRDHSLPPKARIPCGCRCGEALGGCNGKIGKLVGVVLREWPFL